MPGRDACSAPRATTPDRVAVPQQMSGIRTGVRDPAGHRTRHVARPLPCLRQAIRARGFDVRLRAARLVSQRCMRASSLAPHARLSLPRATERAGRAMPCLVLGHREAADCGRAGGCGVLGDPAPVHSNPTRASRDDQPSRVPAVTTQACAAPSSRRVPAPSDSRTTTWQQNVAIGHRRASCAEHSSRHPCGCEHSNRQSVAWR